MIRFSIPGEPALKGSRIAGQRKDGSIYTRPASKREKPWTAAAVQRIWADAKGERYKARPVLVRATFYCQRPAKPTHPHPSRGDVDKMARALLDALVQSGVIGDDRHVTQLEVGKCFSDDPRVCGEVIPLDEPGRLAA